MQKAIPFLIALLIVAGWAISPLLVLGYLAPTLRLTPTIGDLFQPIGTLFTGLAFLGLLYTLTQQRAQVRLISQSFLADHERRKLDATLSSLADARPHLKDFNVFLDTLCGERQNLTAVHVARLKDDPTMRHRLHGGLERLEGVALAINIGLHDEELVYRLTGPFLTNIWSRCEPYVRDFRHEWPTVCVEFEALAERYKAKRASQYAVSPVRHLPM